MHLWLLIISVLCFSLAVTICVPGRPCRRCWSGTLSFSCWRCSLSGAWTCCSVSSWKTNTCREETCLALYLYYSIILFPALMPSSLGFYLLLSSIEGTGVRWKLTCSWRIAPVRQSKCKFGAGRRTWCRRRCADQTCCRWWGRACEGTWKSQTKSQIISVGRNRKQEHCYLRHSLLDQQGSFARHLAPFMDNLDS